MDQELIKGYFILAVVVICLVALVAIMIRKMINAIRGNAPKKEKPPKVKREKREKTKKKTIAKKSKSPLERNAKPMHEENEEEGTMFLQKNRIIMDAEDDEPTIMMRENLASLYIQLVSDTTGEVYSAACTDHITIGRKPECEIQIQGDRSVSGRHCQLKKAGRDTLIVVDLNSSNGTYLNDSKVVNEEYVSDGDTLEIGRTRYTIRIN